MSLPAETLLARARHLLLQTLKDEQAECYGGGMSMDTHEQIMDFLGIKRKMCSTPEQCGNAQSCVGGCNKLDLSNPPPADVCVHRIVDARNEVIASGYFCLDCGSIFHAGDHDAPKPGVTKEWLIGLRDLYQGDGNFAQVWQLAIDRVLNKWNDPKAP